MLQSFELNIRILSLKIKKPTRHLFKLSFKMPPLWAHKDNGDICC